MSQFTHYTEADLDFLDDWAEKWQSLCHVFFDVLYDEPDTPSYDKLDFQYGNRSRWLRENESRFLSLWNPYYPSLDWSISVDKDIITHIEETGRFMENPFGIFYRFYDLKGFMRDITDKTRGKPSHRRCVKVAGTLLAINKLAANFVQWAYDQVDLD